LAQQVILGTVSLDDPIDQYLPEQVVVPVKGSNKITLGILADHTSGLPRMPSNFSRKIPKIPFPIIQLTNCTPLFQPINQFGKLVLPMSIPTLLKGYWGIFLQESLTLFQAGQEIVGKRME